MLDEKTTFTKQQFLKSKSLNWNKDVIQAVLKEEQLYTKKEAERMIKFYLEGKRERKKVK